MSPFLTEGQQSDVITKMTIFGKIHEMTFSLENWDTEFNSDTILHKYKDMSPFLKKDNCGIKREGKKINKQTNISKLKITAAGLVDMTDLSWTSSRLIVTLITKNYQHKEGMYMCVCT